MPCVQVQVPRNENVFTETSCKVCIVGTITAVSKSVCTVTGYDPLPNGNGNQGAEGRAGSLGGVVDDFFQDYRGDAGGGGIVTSLSNKPANSMTKAEVIAKYGSIETWDTSQVKNMRCVFWFKKSINPDIRNWRVDSVVDIHEMFQATNSFNIDLSKEMSCLNSH
jgi:hypothetical protein